MDISHRGGRPGFVRVDGDVLTIPDFRGNRYFNTLSNLLLEQRGCQWLCWGRTVVAAVCHGRLALYSCLGSSVDVPE